jgi:hypothetical protein
MKVPTVAMTKKLVHLLISVDIDNGARMHSYVICPEGEEQQITEDVLCRMADEFEKTGGLWQGTVFLATKLGDGVAVVHEVLDELYPEARSRFDNVEECHLTMWIMGSDDPCDAKLMELH